MMDLEWWTSLRDRLASRLPTAIVSLVSETDEDDASGRVSYAIEVSPVNRCFVALPAPTAKWNAVVFPSSRTRDDDHAAVDVALLKMGRQVVERRTFSGADKDEIVSYLAEHSLLKEDNRLAFCRGVPGPCDGSLSRRQPYVLDFFAGGEVKRSEKCELLVQHGEVLCDFCHTLKMVVDSMAKSSEPPPPPKQELVHDYANDPEDFLVDDEEDEEDDDIVPGVSLGESQRVLDLEGDFIIPDVKLKVKQEEVLNGGTEARKRSRRGVGSSFECKFCGKRFSKRGFLTRHEKSHSKTDDSEACLEGVADDDVEKFVVKKPYKPETRSYNCHLCGVVISRASKYYHMKYVHKVGFEIFKCFCGKEYSSKLGLKKHHLSHTGERPFICSYCGKTFRDNASFNDCQRRCSGKDLYECKTCGKKYPRKERYVIHLRSHTGEKPFACPLCKFACNRKSNLTAHVKRAHQKSLSDLLGKAPDGVGDHSHNHPTHVIAPPSMAGELMQPAEGNQ